MYACNNRNAKGDQDAMFKIRLTIVALFGVLTLSAVAASSATAGWFIEGEASGSKAALASTAKIDTAPVLAVSAGSSKVKVECGGSLLHASEANLIGTESLKAKSVSFEGCKVTEPTTGCALEGQPTTITTTSLLATPAEGVSFPEDTLTLKPQTKKTLAELAFSESSTCLGGGGLKPVVGSLTVKAPTLQEERVTQPIEALGSTENNSLEVAGDKTILEKGKLELALQDQRMLVAAAGIFSAAPLSIDFGKVKIKEPHPDEVTYTNLTRMTAPLPKAKITNEPIFRISNDECAGKAIPQNGTCKVKIIFEPTLSGAEYEAKVRIINYVSKVIITGEGK
jgi:hypothetical protein